VEEGAASEGATEKRQFLVHIDADLIRRTKILAIERHVTASSLVQIAVAEFLSRHSSNLPSANHSEGIPCS
jgi:hypothetical protein